MAMFKPEVMKKVSDDWVIDSLVVYLKSPMWRTPVDKFIKQNCTVFDSEEENKSDIHKNYKKLVDGLLGKLIVDLDITSKQLAKACSRSRSLRRSHKSLYDEVLAAEDFQLFKSIMVQKNTGLEPQAKYQVDSPEAYQPHAKYQVEHSPEAHQPGRGGGDQKATDRMEKLRRASTEEEIMLLKVLEENQKQRLREEEERKKISPTKLKSLQTATDSQQREEVPLSLLLSPPEEMEDEKTEQNTIRITPKHIVPKELSDAAWLGSAEADIAKDTHKPATSSKPAAATNFKMLGLGEEYIRHQYDRLIKMKSKARADGASVSAAPTAAAKYIVSPPKTASTEKTAQDAQADTKGARAKQDTPDSSLASERNRSK